MKPFLNQDRRTRLVNCLTEIGMPEPMAQEFATWPDDVHEIDLRLTALANQLVKYKTKIEGGDHSVEKFYAADLMLLIVYMEEVNERDLSEIDLPMVDAAFIRHNKDFEAQKRCH